MFVNFELWIALFYSAFFSLRNFCPKAISLFVYGNIFIRIRPWMLQVKTDFFTSLKKIRLGVYYKNLTAQGVTCIFLFFFLKLCLKLWYIWYKVTHSTKSKRTLNFNLNPLSVNPWKSSNTRKQCVGIADEVFECV